MIFVIILTVHHRKSTVIANVVAVIVVAITELFLADVTSMIFVNIIRTACNGGLTIVTEVISVVVIAFAYVIVIA